MTTIFTILIIILALIALVNVFAGPGRRTDWFSISVLVIAVLMVIFRFTNWVS